MESRQKGASYPAVTDGDIRAQRLSFPPLPEQRRIVGILDKAFAGIAAATANAKKNLENARAVFESHLQAVFSQRSAFTTAPIGEVAEIFDGPHATPKTVDAGPVFLGISALQDGKVNLGETRHVTPEDFRQWTRRVKPQTDDVVFSYETRLGQAALIPAGLECCLGRRMGLAQLRQLGKK
jgi:type I restriction enzyme S subunit